MFTLDARLQQDTVPVGDLPLCRVLLMNDASYPWFILVPRRADISEVFHLSSAEQAVLWAETTHLAEVLRDAFSADKINIATLGNVVSQLHMHVVARYRTDAAWPAPVWGRQPAVPYTKAQIVAIRERLGSVMGGEFVFSEVRA